jgi:hypothetical protein
MRAPTPVLAALLAAGACIEADERPATWTYVHAAIVAPSCATATCHSALAERAALDLQDRDDAYAALRDGRYVVPGDLSSPLLFLLEGEERVRMPPDAPLPAVDVDLIRAWIADGATP